MNPRTMADELNDLQRRVRDLELAINSLENQARLLRFVGGATVLAVIALAVNALGQVLL